MVLIFSKLGEFSWVQVEPSQEIGLDRELIVIFVGINNFFISDAPVDTGILVFFFLLLLSALELPGTLVCSKVRVVFKHIQIFGLHLFLGYILVLFFQHFCKLIFSLVLLALLHFFVLGASEDEDSWRHSKFYGVERLYFFVCLGRELNPVDKCTVLGSQVHQVEEGVIFFSLQDCVLPADERIIDIDIAEVL